ncbi:RHS repeat protein, partial [Pseudoalteromonas luteoviolacea]|uniref:RHS repeat protein n=1 Tax=Pseudoalteromonas luteoviolacea TaxID=43657 RepID=UPI000AC8F408
SNFKAYTGHEPVALGGEKRIIHMNGRIFDADTGRFMQADPFVQAPSNLQNYNAYSYVLNNPLSYTDPSGYLFKKLGKFVKKHWRSIAAIAAAYYTFGLVEGMLLNSGGMCAFALTSGQMMVAGAASGFVGGVIGSGTLKGGLTGAATGAAFAGIGSMFDGTGGSFWKTGGAGHLGAHALTGGILADVQGGNFGHGFWSAGLTKAANVNGMISSAGLEYDIARIAVAAVIGGTISELTGGKFANGATTAAFAQAYNGNKEAERVRYRKKAKGWRHAEKLETNRQKMLKGQSVIDGAVGAYYDGDNYIGYRKYDVVSVDDSGHWTLTEVKLRDGKVHKYVPFKAYQAATVYSQSEFDYKATDGVTLVGKNIPGGSITLKPGQYSIQWVMMNDVGSATIFPVSIGNEDAMYLNMMRATPYDGKFWD